MSFRSSFEHRDDLLRAALDEFCERGFDAASINRILAASSMSKGQLYHHFESKEALYLGVVEWMIDEKVRWLASHPVDIDATDLFSALRSQMRAAAAFAAARPDADQMTRALLAERGRPIFESVTSRFGFTVDGPLGDLVSAARGQAAFRADLSAEFVTRFVTLIVNRTPELLDLDGASDFERAGRRSHHGAPERTACCAWLESGDVAEVPFDALERQQLCDLFVELGPDAPTLLEPWSTRDLAAHLVLREHDYLAAPGLVLPGRWHRLAARRTATAGRARLRVARQSSQVGAAAWLLPHRLGPEISQPQRVLRASRGRAPGERPGAAEQRAGSRCSPVAQRRSRTVVSCSAPTRRGTRARVGRDKRASASPARRADGSARRTARRTPPVSLRTTSRSPGRGRRRARRRCRRSRHIVRHVKSVTDR